MSSTSESTETTSIAVSVPAAPNPSVPPSLRWELYFFYQSVFDFIQDYKSNFQSALLLHTCEYSYYHDLHVRTHNMYYKHTVTYSHGVNFYENEM